MERHKVSFEYRVVMAKGYQDQMYESTAPYIQCTCGWEQMIGDLHPEAEYRLLRLEHLVEVLMELGVDPRWTL
jgi:hypothetical protein